MAPTLLEARHISVSINRRPADVYAYASDPANLPAWASGLSGSITEKNGEWIADSPMGKIKIRFDPPNEYGVLDHEVELESGVLFYNPMRVVANGPGSEVIFTLFRQPDMDEAAFQADASMIQNDISTLKNILESKK
ncbi:MAG: SRPBCC family protein [Candidatus Omnitrophota bacterium]